jgi:hypothetical protein
MIRTLPALLLSACIFIGCASSAPSTSSNARVYPVTFYSALSGVVDTISEMRMEIESSTPEGTQPFVVVATFATESARRGTISSETRMHTLQITLEELGGDGIVVRVRPPAQADLTSGRPNETQIRFLSLLDRRMGSR